MTTKEIVKDARLLARNPQTKGDERVARWVLRHAPVVVAAVAVMNHGPCCDPDCCVRAIENNSARSVLANALAAAEESADELLSPVEGEPQQEVEDD